MRQRGFVERRQFLSGAKDGFTQAPQSSGPLTVWVDSTRVPAAQAYEKAHPGVKINMVVYDGDSS